MRKCKIIHYTKQGASLKIASLIQY